MYSPTDFHCPLLNGSVQGIDQPCTPKYATVGSYWFSLYPTEQSCWFPLYRDWPTLYATDQHCTSLYSTVPLIEEIFFSKYLKYVVFIDIHFYQDLCCIYIEKNTTCREKLI